MLFLTAVQTAELLCWERSPAQLDRPGIVSGETQMSESCVRRSQKARAQWALGRPALSSQIGVVMVALLLLSDCSALQRTRSDKPAGTPPAAPAATTATPPPLPAPVRAKRQVRETRENKEPERVASVDPKSLIGLAPGAVEKLLGSPSNVSKSDPSLVWTYAGQGCSFQVYFYPDIKTASFHALKYSSTAGEQTDCLRNILMVRSNGPS
jgi:glucose/arabinose dehydrogenase